MLSVCAAAGDLLEKRTGGCEAVKGCVVWLQGFQPPLPNKVQGLQMRREYHPRLRRD